MEQNQRTNFHSVTKKPYPKSAVLLGMAILALPLMIFYILPCFILAVVVWSRTSEVLNRYKVAPEEFKDYTLSTIRAAHLVAKGGIWISIALFTCVAIFYLYNHVIAV
jgi:hypothetical protein